MVNQNTIQGNFPLTVNEFLNVIDAEMTLAYQCANAGIANDSRIKELEIMFKTKFKEIFPDEHEKNVDRVFKHAKETAYKEYLTQIIKGGYQDILKIDVPVSDSRINEWVNSITKQISAIDLVQQGLIETKLKETFNMMPEYNNRGIFIESPNNNEISLLTLGTKIGRKLAVLDIKNPVPDEWIKTEDFGIITSINSLTIKPIYQDIGSDVFISVNGITYNPEIGLALNIEINQANERIIHEFNVAKEHRQPYIVMATAPGINQLDVTDLFETNENTIQINFDTPTILKGVYGGITKEGEIDTEKQTSVLWFEYEYNQVHIALDTFKNTYQIPDGVSIHYSCGYIVMRTIDPETNKKVQFDLCKIDLNNPTDVSAIINKEVMERFGFNTELQDIELENTIDVVL